MKIKQILDFSIRTVIVLAVFISGSQLSSMHDNEHLCDGFVEENNLRIPVSNYNQKLLGGVSEAEFNQAIGLVESVYAPIFAKKGQKLQMKKMWSNDQVNAVAYKKNGYSVIEIWGGLARHSVMTTDGVILVTCHEVGHHLGGLPKYTGSGNNWAAVEGEADYFATLKCLRKVFASQASTWSGNVDRVVQDNCTASFGEDTNEAKICMRIGMAGLASAQLSAAISNGRAPSFSTNDPSVVAQTYESHPAAQCRLDTYVKGDYCTVSDTIDVSDTNLETGTCRNIENEEFGARPRCWYKPTPAPIPTDGIALTPNLNGTSTYSTNNPNQVITLTWEVSSFAGAKGIYFEITRPNGEFSSPNGTMPDAQAMPGGSVPAVRGRISILPARQLPGWGVYKFRIIALDRTGRKAVSRFSNSATLNLQK
ncbi:MAG: hypothetical protein A2Z20_08595 [Bdellovibrionales bacterium RBG_16_40_8]|nr:MAG: hypothetical protein A2Z20_08595 [Bdellovibrionales bacterium RBG_16_40_8]